MYRAASKDDAENLSGLAFNSEKYLGYDSNYMNKFSALYNVTEKFIDKQLVYIMEDAEIILGFWGLKNAESNWELEFFYITVEYIGKGYGRRLWNHLIAECKKWEIKEFQFVTSHQSTQFYEKMGAEVVGQIESLIIQGKMIPKLKYIVTV